MASHEVKKFERVDLHKEKAKLTQVLRGDAPRYWEFFKNFIQARITKAEFDKVVKSVLGDNIQLHNQFIFAILNNAHCPQLPAESFTARKRKRPEKPLADTPQRKKRKKPSEEPISPSAKTFVISKKSFGGLIRIQNILPPGPFEAEPNLSLHDLQFLTFPELLGLRVKMVNLAKETGIAEVPNETVKFMMNAIEHHLKEILSRCLAHSRQNGESSISKATLLDVLKVKPQLFGDIASVQMEKALFIQS